MTVREQDELQVAALRVTQWGGSDGPGAGLTVLGLPGLGSSGYAWQALADALPGARFVAPHLRGRGPSARISGPTGLRAHALDVAAVVHELDLREVVLVGHSMGAYLAPVLTRMVPDHIARLVLVDGGLPPRLPFFMGPRLTRFAFGRQIGKLERDWPSAEALYEKYAGKILANRPDLVPTVTEMLARDLDGPPGALRPVLDREHAVADAVDTFFGSEVIPALEALTVPAHLVAATHGKTDRVKAFLADSVLQHWTQRLPLLSAERVDSNHVTVVFTPEVEKAVAG